MIRLTHQPHTFTILLLLLLWQEYLRFTHSIFSSISSHFSTTPALVTINLISVCMPLIFIYFLKCLFIYLTAPGLLWHVGSSSLTWDQTWAPALEVWNLDHWIYQGSPQTFSFDYKLHEEKNPAHHVYHHSLKV